GWLAPLRLFSVFWSCRGKAEATVRAVAIRPSPLPVLCPARLPARRPSVTEGIEDSKGRIALHPYQLLCPARLPARRPSVRRGGSSRARFESPDEANRATDVIEDQETLIVAERGVVMSQASVVPHAVERFHRADA